MHTWDTVFNTPIRSVQSQLNGLCFVVPFNKNHKAPIDFRLPDHIKQEMQRDPYAITKIQQSPNAFKDILLALLYVSLEYKKHGMKFTPDNFNRALHRARLDSRSVVFNCIGLTWQICKEHVAYILENWFLGLFEFLDDLHQRDKLELLIRLQLVQVVPHGIVFREE